MHSSRLVWREKREQEKEGHNKGEGAFVHKIKYDIHKMTYIPSNSSKHFSGADNVWVEDD